MEGKSVKPDTAAEPKASDAADGEVPMSEWVPHPVSDSAEYLDREAPVYARDLTGADREAYDAAMSERAKKLAGHKSRVRPDKSS